jgi:hypothetical protein
VRDAAPPITKGPETIRALIRQAASQRVCAQPNKPNKPNPAPSAQTRHLAHLAHPAVPGFDPLQ